MTSVPGAAESATALVGHAPLAFDDLRVAFGGNVVLAGVSIRFKSGFNGLIGPNGGGKTTCFNVTSGYVKPERGEVRLDGHPVLGLPQASVAAMGLGRTFQSPRLVLGMSVLDNVLLGMHYRYRHWHWQEALGLAPARLAERERRERAYDLLESFGLEEHARSLAGNLSLGSQKVVEVARALAPDPGVLLLDEPAAGMGAPDVEVLLRGLRNIVDEQKLCVVIIEHDLKLVMSLCPVVAVLHDGRIIAHGSPAEVAKEPLVVDAYLGASIAAET